MTHDCKNISSVLYTSLSIRLIASWVHLRSVLRVHSLWFHSLYGLDGPPALSLGKTRNYEFPTSDPFVLNVCCRLSVSRPQQEALINSRRSLVRSLEIQASAITLDGTTSSSASAASPGSILEKWLPPNTRQGTKSIMNKYSPRLYTTITIIRTC